MFDELCRAVEISAASIWIPTAVAAAIITAIATLGGQSWQRAIDRRKSVRKYYYPLLASLIALEARLERIFNNIDKNWLESSLIKRVLLGKGFSIDPKADGYFYCSTSYHIAAYFCWIAIINREVGYLYKSNTKQSKSISKLSSTIVRLFRYKEIWINCESINAIEKINKAIPRDASQLYEQFQQSLGESLIISYNNHYRCMTFKEYFESYLSDKNFRFWVLAVEDYYSDLSNMQGSSLYEKSRNSNDIRPFRLLALRYYVRRLIDEYSRVLGEKQSRFTDSLFIDIPDDIVKSIIDVDNSISRSGVGLSPYGR